MGSIESETETSLRVIATKCYDTEETGLVSISGWKGFQSEETPILFTVLDKVSQTKWTRLVEHSSSKRDTLKVKIPRSVVHHQIVATAELLRENKSCAKDKTRSRRFTVESTSTCVAIPTVENFHLELLISLCRGMSTSNANKGLPTTISLEIERRSTDLAGLRLKKTSKGIVRWLITIEEVEANNRKDVFLIPADKDTTDFEFRIEDGKEYHIEAILLDCTGGNIFCQGSTNYKADVHRGLQTVPYAVEELRQLHGMAVSHAGRKNASCLWLYRNKKPQYFREILKKQGGIMKPYIKDNSGDPRSPINNQIDGLFFMASVKPGSKKGEPIPESAFGSTRVLVPAVELLAKGSNLYFTDFYCMTGKRHYVTLVMTRPGSKSDKFCATRLLSLNLCDRSSNPFFFFDESSQQLRVSTKNQLFVELLFTEDLDIRKYRRMETKIGENCRGFSKNGGKPKDSNCRVCNLPNRN